MKKVLYETMTNPQILQIAEKRRIKFPANVWQEFHRIRGIEDSLNVRMIEVRKEAISILEKYDKQKNYLTSLILKILGLLVSMIGLILGYIKLRNGI